MIIEISEPKENIKKGVSEGYITYENSKIHYLYPNSEATFEKYSESAFKKIEDIFDNLRINNSSIFIKNKDVFYLYNLKNIKELKTFYKNNNLNLFKLYFLTHSFYSSRRFNFLFKDSLKDIDKYDNCDLEESLNRIDFCNIPYQIVKNNIFKNNNMLEVEDYLRERINILKDVTHFDVISLKLPMLLKSFKIKNKKEIYSKLSLLQEKAENKVFKEKYGYRHNVYNSKRNLFDIFFNNGSNHLFFLDVLKELDYEFLFKNEEDKNSVMSLYLLNLIINHLLKKEFYIFSIDLFHLNFEEFENDYKDYFLTERDRIDNNNIYEGNITIFLKTLKMEIEKETPKIYKDYVKTNKLPNLDSVMKIIKKIEKDYNEIVKPFLIKPSKEIKKTVLKKEDEKINKKQKSENNKMNTKKKIEKDKKSISKNKIKKNRKNLYHHCKFELGIEVVYRDSKNFLEFAYGLYKEKGIKNRKEILDLYKK